MDAIPEKVNLSILENFQVNGTVPITQSQIANMFNSFQQNELTIKIIIIITSSNKLKQLHQSSVHGHGVGGFILFQLTLHFLGAT